MCFALFWSVKIRAMFNILIINPSSSKTDTFVREILYTCIWVKILFCVVTLNHQTFQISLRQITVWDFITIVIFCACLTYVSMSTSLLVKYRLIRRANCWTDSCIVYGLYCSYMFVCMCFIPPYYIFLAHTILVPSQHLLT